MSVYRLSYYITGYAVLNCRYFALLRKLKFFFLYFFCFYSVILSFLEDFLILLYTVVCILQYFILLLFLNTPSFLISLCLRNNYIHFHYYMFDNEALLYIVKVPYLLWTNVIQKLYWCNFSECASPVTQIIRKCEGILHLYMQQYLYVSIIFHVLHVAKYMYMYI